MDRAYLSIAAGSVPHESDSALFGELAKKLPFALEPTQTAAWEYQIRHLRQLAVDLPHAHFFMEFLIPRMGRRADLIILHAGVIFVVEYKLGARQFDRSSLLSPAVSPKVVARILMIQKLSVTAGTFISTSLLFVI